MGQEKDPICGMMVATETARFVLERGGKKFYFCSAACRDRFARSASG